MRLRRYTGRIPAGDRKFLQEHHFMRITPLLIAATFFAQIAAPAAPAQTTSAPSTDQRKAALDKVFTDYWEDRLKHSPEEASSLGDKRYDAYLTDYSVAAYDASLDRGRGFLERLGAIDTAGLDDQEKLSKDLLVRTLVEQQEEAEFKPWEMPISQFGGIHIELPQLVAQLSFDGQTDYDNYVLRLKAVPTAFEQITTNLMTAMDDNRVLPKYLIDKVIVQVNTLATQKPEDSPFARPLQKFPAGISAAQQEADKQEVMSALQRSVLPAYARLAKFLQAQYEPKGRTDPGIWALPDGKAYYAFRVRQSTTTNLTPEQIHKIGEQQVAEDEAQMLAIAHKLGFADLAAMSSAMKTNPKLHPTSAEAIIDAYRGYIQGMHPKLPQLFGRLPKAPVEVKPVPTYMEKDSADAYYQEGTPDGKRPGAVFVDTYKFADRDLADVEAIAYHEGVPGHHLQISIAQELTGIPDFRKHSYYTAYTEGWGLYAEHLGKDIGFYQDPYSDFGRLQGDIWRAIRLVVDTGVHEDHWTRQQMIDYFHAHSSINETSVQAETDRYIAWPAQALGYKIGQLKFLELRAKAEKALGPKFDIRAFHDEVIDSGALPLDILTQRVDAWIEAQGAAK